MLSGTTITPPLRVGPCGIAILILVLASVQHAPYVLIADVGIRYKTVLRYMLPLGLQSEGARGFYPLSSKEHTSRLALLSCKRAISQFHF